MNKHIFEEIVLWRITCVQFRIMLLFQAWNGQIKGYRVLYVPFPRHDQPSHSKLNTARLSAVIGTTTALTNLSPYTNYSVQILAYTSAGDGELSSPVSCATEPDGNVYKYF